MSLEANDLQTIVSKYRAMDIEELKENIIDLKEESDCSLQLPNLDFVMNKLELKYKER